MKRLSVIIAAVVLFASCEQSDGAKYGLQQKVSHKTFPCDYYEIQVSFEGGKAQSNGQGGDGGYSNAQDFKVNKACFDTLNNHIGDHVVIEYKDGGFAVCGESKEITSLRTK